MNSNSLETFYKSIRDAINLHAAAQRQEALMMYYADTQEQRDLKLNEAEEIAKVMPSSYILLQFVQTVREAFTE